MPEKRCEKPSSYSVACSGRSLGLPLGTTQFESTGPKPGIGLDFAVDDDRRKEIALGEQRRREIPCPPKSADALTAERSSLMPGSPVQRVAERGVVGVVEAARKAHGAADLLRSAHEIRVDALRERLADKRARRAPLGAHSRRMRTRYRRSCVPTIDPRCSAYPGARRRTARPRRLENRCCCRRRKNRPKGFPNPAASANTCRRRECSARSSHCLDRRGRRRPDWGPRWASRVKARNRRPGRGR